MSERIPTLKNEANRESGLIVPGEYAEGNKAKDYPEEPTKKHGFGEEKEKLKIRGQIIESIHRADAINDRFNRINTLAEIAQNVMNGDNADLAIEAAIIMQNSRYHKGSKAKKLENTKKIGARDSFYNSLLVQISDTNQYSSIGIVAADHIDMCWLRNKTLANRSNDSVRRIVQHYKSGGGLKENHYSGGEGDSIGETIYNILKEQDLDDLARSLIKGRFGRKYKNESSVERAKILLDPFEVTTNSIRFFMKKQEILRDIAIESGDRALAKKIILPKFNKEAIKAIDKRLNT
jgi:hypothetical protein